jgi:hypothetical protein
MVIQDLGSRQVSATSSGYEIAVTGQPRSHSALTRASTLAGRGCLSKPPSHTCHYYWYYQHDN